MGTSHSLNLSCPSTPSNGIPETYVIMIKIRKCYNSLCFHSISEHVWDCEKCDHHPKKGEFYYAHLKTNKMNKLCPCTLKVSFSWFNHAFYGRQLQKKSLPQTLHWIRLIVLKRDKRDSLKSRACMLATTLTLISRL